MKKILKLIFLLLIVEIFFCSYKLIKEDNENIAKFKEAINSLKVRLAGDTAINYGIYVQKVWAPFFRDSVIDYPTLYNGEFISSKKSILVDYTDTSEDFSYQRISSGNYEPESILIKMEKERADTLYFYINYFYSLDLYEDKYDIYPIGMITPDNRIIAISGDYIIPQEFLEKRLHEFINKFMQLNKKLKS